MNRIVSMPNRNEIAEQAAVWVVRLDSERMDAEALRDFRAWLALGPDHRRAAERMAELYDRLDVLAICRTSVESHQAEGFHYKRMLAVAAGITFMALVLWVVMQSPTEVVPGVLEAVQLEPGEIYSTAIGEQKTIPLPDGSSIRLNTASRVEIRYTAESRMVLLQLGEAFFEVAHESTRPFMVDTDRGLVTAVGTAFSVRIEPAQVQVTVQNGRVQVARKEIGAQSMPGATSVVSLTALVDRGQTFRLSENADKLEVLPPAELMRELAWRDGMLVFDGDSLATVVKEVSRYDDLEIVISDPILRDRRIGGYFRVGETDTLLAALETNFGIQVERVNDRLIYLRPVSR